VSATWEDASKCPRDGQFTGKVVSRKSLGRDGQLVTLECPEDNCPYHANGWIVQLRADGSIPDPVAAESRERRFLPTPSSSTRKRIVMDALEEQVALEQSKGGEVRGI
jgi:hypothetical protein